MIWLTGVCDRFSCIDSMMSATDLWNSSQPGTSEGEEMRARGPRAWVNGSYCVPSSSFRTAQSGQSGQRKANGVFRGHHQTTVLSPVCVRTQVTRGPVSTHFRFGVSAVVLVPELDGEQ